MTSSSSLDSILDSLNEALDEKFPLAIKGFTGKSYVYSWRLDSDKKLELTIAPQEFDGEIITIILFLVSWIGAEHWIHYANTIMVLDSIELDWETLIDHMIEARHKVLTLSVVDAPKTISAVAEFNQMIKNRYADESHEE